MASLEVDIFTFTDADFNLVQNQPFANGLTSASSNALHMQIRATPTDPTVWADINTFSTIGSIIVGNSGATVTIYIPQSVLAKMPPGAYVYSVVMSVQTQQGQLLRTELFRGNVTHAAGPTQWQAGTV